MDQSGGRVKWIGEVKTVEQSNVVRVGRDTGGW